MKPIDNLLAGLIGFALIAAFGLGLAESIGTAPFWVIVLFVLGLAGYDFYESCIKKKKNGGSS